MSIKPIQTWYKDIPFRSRLEARWAVFFQALGVKWDYEREGFVSEGSCFLPDFYLTDYDCWIEIKHENLFETNIKEYAKTIVDVAYFAGGGDEEERNSLLIFGSPFFDAYKIIGSIKGYGELPNQSRFALGYTDRKELWIRGEQGAVCLNPFTHDDKFPLSDCDEIMQAYGKARAARFEHGEKPD